MRNSQWSEKQLENLLRQMPQMSDDRDAYEIFQNISLKANKRKRKVWLMPAVASAGVLLLFVMIASILLNIKQAENKSIRYTANPGDDTANTTLDEKEHNEFARFNDGKGQDTSDPSPIRPETLADQSTAVYHEDIEGKEVLTYAIPDRENKFVVPVSILAVKKANKTKYRLFRENMHRLQEDVWGLNEYYPLHANIKFDEKLKILKIDVEKSNPYNRSLSTERIFKQFLSNTAQSLQLTKIALTTEGRPGIKFSGLGTLQEIAPEELSGKYAYYFYYPNHSQTRPYIVPFGNELTSVKDAFNAMKKNQKEANLQASIPKGIQFETKENRENKTITIRFTNGSKLSGDMSLYSLEAILLTAKEFEYDVVKLENADIDRIGRFDLRRELQVPVAANKIELP